MKKTHTLTHTWTSIPVYPLWFSVTTGIWWNPAQVCMLSRGLQRSSPHRESETSQILPGITPSFSIFTPRSMRRLSGSDSFWIPCSRNLILPLLNTSLPVPPFLLVLPSSRIFLTLDPWVPLFCCTHHCSAQLSRSRERTNTGRKTVGEWQYIVGEGM